MGLTRCYKTEVFFTFIISRTGVARNGTTTTGKKLVNLAENRTTWRQTVSRVLNTNGQHHHHHHHHHYPD